MGWGQGHINNAIGWGQGYDAIIGWGSIYTTSNSGQTNITGE